MARLAGITDQGGWHCERTGEETIGVQNTVGYRAVAASGAEFLGWIDAARKFPLRIKTEDGAVITAENIRDEPQAASVVRDPAGIPEVRSANFDSADQAKRRLGCRRERLNPSYLLLVVRIGAGVNGYCAWIPAARATSVQRLTSLVKNASKAAGSVAIGSTAIAAMRCFGSSSAMPFAIAW